MRLVALVLTLLHMVVLLLFDIADISSTFMISTRNCFNIPVDLTRKVLLLKELVESWIARYGNDFAIRLLFTTNKYRWINLEYKKQNKSLS